MSSVTLVESDGLSVVDDSRCVTCDPSCRKCTGTEAIECTSCYSDKYLLSSNNSCVSCDVDGYFISGTQCLQCDSTCRSCNDVTATNCISCYEGFYLLTTSNSCTPCKNIPGYYVNDIDLPFKNHGPNPQI